VKNHIAFKFLAVLLCAASLLGAVGSGLGIFALTEGDLYDKTVEQVYEEQVMLQGQEFAEQTARIYASLTLGGMPSVTVDQGLGYRNYFREPHYGYRLLDAEGNELESRMPEGQSWKDSYSFPVSGNYMHLVEVTSISQELEQQEPVAEGYPNDGSVQYMNAPYDVLVDEIPEEGAVLTEIQLSGREDGNGVSGGEVGTVFRNREGVVIMRSPGWHLGELDPVVTAIALWDIQGKLIYEASAEDGVGLLSYAKDGTEDLIFTSFLPYAGPMVAEMPAEPTEMTEAVTEATEAPTEATEAATEETEEVTEATEEATETSETEVETVPEEKESGNKKKNTEETAPVTEPEKAEAAEATEPEKSEKENNAGETSATEETGEAAEETVEPTVEETVETVPQETAPAETIPEETEPVLINGKPLQEYQINRDGYYDETLGENITVEYVYVPMPEMTVELYLAPGAIHAEAVYTELAQVRQIREYLFPAMGICLLLLAITAVYLCCAAGRKPKSKEVRASGLNRIPLDLYAGAMGLGVAGLAVAGVEGGEYLLEQNASVGMAFCGGCAFLACLLIVGFCFAFVAQIKTPGGFWWRNSLCGICLRLSIRLLKGTWHLCVKGWPLLIWLVKECWKLLKSLWLWFWGTLGRFYKWLYKGLSRIYDLLPITWQWLLTGAVIFLFLFITLLERFELGIVLAVAFGFVMILYGAHCFGTLMEATRKMNRGDLNSKADDKMMIGAFRDFAHDLNDLAKVAVVAAQKQLKSERMKTELITNVSHDIKTPLTSIINYVDLLQKPHTEEEEKQYLEVLDRQSQRLKKLIEDLMEMSKASTGNMAVDITLVDAVESVNQALGEFSDKLDRAQLVPVFRHTEPSVAMMADGRLVWRVLSNLLSNAVKYAMPGTRLYIDLMELEGKVVISLKNISREELNVDAEELMERFVRGDGSRNTEGSGLGLNIAKSLMELQKGQLQLLVDGDLFKVTLIFPGI